MTIVYTQNFDGVTLPALPPGWSAVSGTWLSTASSPVSSPNALVNSPAQDGKVIMCTAPSALADMDLRYDVNSPNNGLPGPLLRMDSSFQNGYALVVANQNFTAFNVYKIIGGTSTQIGTISSGYTGGNIGVILSVRARIQGTNIYIKVWSYGATEPISWGGTLSDSSISAANYFGFYNNVPTGGSGLSTIDNIVLDNLTSASDFAITPSSRTTSVSNATGAYAVQPNGFPSSAATIALSDAGVGGTFSPSASLSFPTTNNDIQTFTYTPAAGSAGSTVTLTATATGGLTTTHSVSCVVSGSTATDFSLAPSSQGTAAGTATANYTVTPNGTPSSSTTIALSDGGAGGSFTPATLTLTTSAAKTFTYTPSGSASPGTITLTVIASGGFSASHTTNCVVTSGPQTLSVTNSAFFWSPGNWDRLASGVLGVSTYTMQATAPGAYLKFNVSGTVNLHIDIDNLTNSGFPSGDMPIVRYSVDGTAFTDVQLAPSQTRLTLSSSLTMGAHSVEFYFKASSNSSGYGDVWGSSGVSPTNVLRINGITVDAGSSVSTPTLLPKRMLIFGDSITAGEHINPDGSDDATQSFAPMLARALGAEFGQLGYGAQGWTITGGSNAAPFQNAWNLYSAGRSRSFAGLDYLAVIHGGNDARSSVPGPTIQNAAQTWLASARAACGSSTRILVFVECMGSYEADLSAAVSAYKANSGDTNVFFVDGMSLMPTNAFGLTFLTGPFLWTFDGVHPLISGHGRIGAIYAGQAQAAMAASTPTGYSRSRVVNA